MVSHTTPPSSVRILPFYHYAISWRLRLCVTLFHSGHDVALQPDQSKPAIDLIDELLASATGKNNTNNTLTQRDISAFSTKRRQEARASNGQFSLSTNHKFIGSLKYVKTVFLP